MLFFDIRSLGAKAALVDGDLHREDPVWQSDDARPIDVVHIAGRLSAAASGQFYFHGTLEGAIIGECRRCLTEVSADVHEELQLLYADADDETANDVDVYTIKSTDRELDLRPAIREQWLLASPKFFLCRADCLGLCVSCGADRNVTTCDCAVAGDTRWKDLRTAAGDSG